MLRPSYSISLDQETLSSESLGPLIDLQIRRDKSGAADEAIVTLGRVSKISLTEGAEVSVELGWDGETETVFSGIIETVDRGIDQLEVVCLGQQSKLMKTRADKVLVSQKAGQVVTALAGEAGVQTETIEDGIDLPVYLVDSSVNLHEHCLSLARRCGFDLYTNEKGKLIFSRFNVTAADHTFRYREQILGASIEKGTPRDEVTVVPESPASSSGDETVSWLIKDPAPHTAKAGGGASALLVSDPMLRTKEAADSAAKAQLYFSQRDALAGSLKLMGTPEIQLGEAVALKDLPDDEVNQLYQVMAIRHCLNKRRGFYTDVVLGGMP